MNIVKGPNEAKVIDYVIVNKKGGNQKNRSSIKRQEIGTIEVEKYTRMKSNLETKRIIKLKKQKMKN